jgi:hypothetical protein
MAPKANSPRRGVLRKGLRPAIEEKEVLDDLDENGMVIYYRSGLSNSCSDP